VYWQKTASWFFLPLLVLLLWRLDHHSNCSIKNSLHILQWYCEYIWFQAEYLLKHQSKYLQKLMKNIWHTKIERHQHITWPKLNDIAPFHNFLQLWKHLIGVMVYYWHLLASFTNFHILYKAISTPTTHFYLLRFLNWMDPIIRC